MVRTLKKFESEQLAGAEDSFIDWVKVGQLEGETRSR